MQPPYPSFTETWHNAPYDTISPTRHELSVADKTIIITGGGRGLGPEIARAFAAAGAAHLALIGRTQSTLSQTAENLKKEFASVVVSTHAADIADEAAMMKAAEAVKKWDVLILNAGVLAADPQPIEKSDFTEWWRIFEASILQSNMSLTTNVKGAMVTTKAFLPFRTPDASIVGLNANLITLPVSFAKGSSAYYCSKLAQLKMLEFLASEDPDLFVVSIHPGVYPTDMLNNSKMENTVPKELLDDMSLAPHFLVWVVSKEARFLKGRFVCANWDVKELMGKKKEIETSRILEANVHGWPYGKAMDAMLAQAEGER